MSRRVPGILTGDPPFAKTLPEWHAPSEATLTVRCCSMVPFWLEALVTVAATFAGVALAFWLDRVIERRRADAATIWLARHWLKDWEYLLAEGPGWTMVRRLTHGRPVARGEVQRALAELSPAVAEWYIVNTMDVLPPSGSRAEREAALRRNLEQIDAQLAAFTETWPPRPVRLRRLLKSRP